MMKTFDTTTLQQPCSLTTRMFFAALRILAVAFVLAAAFLSPEQIYAAVQGETPENSIIISEYKDQIRFIDSEIQTLKSNMNFLQFKIDRMESESRFVPPEMRKSIEFKKSKLKALKSLRNRYQKMIPEKKVSRPTKPRQQANNAPATSVTPVKVKKVHDNNIMAQVNKAGLADWLEPIPQAPCTYLTTRLPILFSSGSAEIPKGYQSFLKKLAGFLKNYDVHILVKGYADTDPIHTKKYPSNLELGASRAGAIARALMGYGIKPSVFEVASTGQYRFISQQPLKWKNLQRHATIQILFPDCRKP